MSTPVPAVAISNGFAMQLRDLIKPPSRPVLVVRNPTEAERPASGRARIWEFNTNLHCSIIGTCLTTIELRQILRRLGMAPEGSTDHELHGTAVTLASRRDQAAKVLNKALDAKHRIAINQFSKAQTEDELRQLWQAGVQRGEIPGAYWATLTHPQTSPALIRAAFGEVHMLSHLIGSTNRADIKRLCQLETEKSELQAKIKRQQQAFQDAVVARDTRIQELGDAIAQRIITKPVEQPSVDEMVLRRIITDLEKRLAAETRRRASVEAQLVASTASLAQERSARAQADHIRRQAEAELAVIEQGFAGTAEHGGAPGIDLRGIVVLYVGGRPNQTAHLRAAAEKCGAVLLHHDGGLEAHSSTLPGLASRADVVLFPVDCVSHEAVLAVKAICRQAGKRFIPLRSASTTSLMAALGQLDTVRLADAAE